ncbi:lanthionine synthetase C family protein [Streptomyces chartreusis]|uniref:lanthionine synthetase C family protein n=1 Tax=Streptomyces chartreusis TaxID=1969 RepID=UPI002E1918DC
MNHSVSDSFPSAHRVDTRAGTRARALEVAYEVAARLADISHVQRHVTPVPGGEGPLLANGSAGVALLMAELAPAGAGRTEAALAHLLDAARAHAGAGAGLFSGLAGLGFAARAVEAVCDGRTRALTASLRRALTPAADALADRVLSHLATDDAPLRSAHYDHLHGVGGLALHLLHDADYAPDPDTLGKVVTALTRLTGRRCLNGRSLPAWAVNGNPGDDAAAVLPLGLAHGIAGTLAVLCHIQLAGHRHPGLGEAIERLASCLVHHRRPAPTGRHTWPRHVRITHEGQARPARPDAPLSWRYGDTGIAVALDLAGRALKRPDLCRRAVQAATVTVLRREHPVQRDAGLCHGWAGLLAVVDHALPSTPWARGVADLAARHVLEQYRPEAPFCFRSDLGPSPKRHDDPGFLTGAAGIALALHAYGTQSPPHTRWPALLLLPPP